MNSSILNNSKSAPLASLSDLAAAKLMRQGPAQGLGSQSPTAPMAADQSGNHARPTDWGLARLILFRFVCVYLTLYIAPFPLEYIPVVNILAGVYSAIWTALVSAVSLVVFDVQITTLPMGSGDTTWNYVHLFCLLVMSTLATAVWSLLHWKGRSYVRLSEWLRVYVRFCLASALFVYGALKVIKAQFPDPSLEYLTQPVGDGSPMRLLWAFMGASTPYSMFTGVAEMLGGLLLTMRRTTLLGALLAIGVMGNVVMLNLCYDVPVKIYSSHLLLMAVFIAAPDLRRLGSFFLLNRTTAPGEQTPLFRQQWLHRGTLVVRTLAVIAFVAYSLDLAFANHKAIAESRSQAPIYGIWTVEDFVADGAVRPPLVTDQARWRRLICGNQWSVTTQLMDDTRQRYLLEVNADQGTVVLTKFGDPASKTTFYFSRPEPGRLLLQGTLDGREVRMTLRLDNREFLLVNRGFHWINEVPFNR